MDEILQRITQLEEKIDYLISLQNNQNQQGQILPQSPIYRQERNYPIGLDFQRFGTLTRGFGKS